jgi:hypothetical protein
MKPRWDQSEFNTPQEMLVRAAYLVCLAAFTSGILLMLAGAVAHERRLLGLGAAALAVALVTRELLRRGGHLNGAETALNAIARTEPPLDVARVAELVRLLREWEQMERKRGSADFDPWVVQALRHDIRMMVEKDPELDRLFHV